MALLEDASGQAFEPLSFSWSPIKQTRPISDEKHRQTGRRKQIFAVLGEAFVFRHQPEHMPIFLVRLLHVHDARVYLKLPAISFLYTVRGVCSLCEAVAEANKFIRP
jgi:hypothetical protein